MRCQKVMATFIATAVAVITLLQANYPLVAATLAQRYERRRVLPQPSPAKPKEELNTAESHTGASPQVTQVGHDYFIEIGRHEQTGAKFRISQRYPNLVKSEPCLFNMDVKEILGVVPNNTNFLDDELVLNITRIGIREFEQRCPQVKTQTLRLQKTYRNNNSTFLIHVYLFGEQSWARYQGGSHFTDEIHATYVVTSSGAIELKSMTNRVKQQAAKAAQTQTRLQAQQEQQQKVEDQRRAEQAKLAKQQAADDAVRQKRFREFARKHGVRELVPLSILSPNPYVYKGQVVAMPVRFERMTSSNTARFIQSGWNDHWVEVSGVPSDIFRTRGLVLIAIRVGQREPLFSFAGVHFCEKEGCGEMLPGPQLMEECGKRKLTEYQKQGKDTSLIMVPAIAEEIQGKCLNELSK